MADSLLRDPLTTVSILLALANGLLLVAFRRAPAVERAHARTR
jgi:hypothetical protein